MVPKLVITKYAYLSTQELLNLCVTKRSQSELIEELCCHIEELQSLLEALTEREVGLVSRDHDKTLLTLPCVVCGTENKASLHVLEHCPTCEAKLPLLTIDKESVPVSLDAVID